MKYEHTQIGYLMFLVLAFVLVIFAIVFLQDGFLWSLGIVMILIIAILLSFSTLNVKIDNEYLRVRFGWGIFSSKFKLKQITNVKRVKNHWYHGWGIRFWLWPKMRIYNVSGFDAVEIIVNNKDRFRIGTDEPKKLERVLLDAIKSK